MKDIISKELLSEVLKDDIIKINKHRSLNNKISIDCFSDIELKNDILVCYENRQNTYPFKLIDEHEYNIYKIANNCLVFAYDNMYEITPRVMGAETMCLKNGELKKLISRKDIKEPKAFDPRFIIKAAEWVLKNK